MNKEIVEEKKDIKNVAIFGGSFDPPTFAHIKIAENILSNLKNIDQIWIIPCGDNRSDKKLRTPGIHRLKMLELIKEDYIKDKNLPIFVNDYEIKNNKYFPTYFLIKDLEKIYKNIHFIFCCGLELVEGLVNWDESEKLLNEIEFLFIDRNQLISEEDFNSKKNIKFPIKYSRFHYSIKGSSTEIRGILSKKINDKENLGIGDLTSKSVIKYIKENNLYNIKENYF